MPSRSPNSWNIAHWNTPGADLIPNGRRKKRKRPIGIAMVHKYDDSSVSGIWKNPEVASRTAKYRTLLMRPNNSSVEGMENYCRCIALFSPDGSMQSRLFDLLTTTIGPTQSVGSVTLVMIPVASMSPNFFATGSRSR